MTTATEERVYTELDLPHAAHPERVLYAVQAQGYEGCWPAILKRDQVATLVNVNDPWEVPTIQPGQSAKDFQHIFANLPKKATGQAKVRGWKLVSGAFQGETAYELAEAARPTNLKVPVSAVYLWCAGPGPNGSEHGMFLGAKPPEQWADADKPECQDLPDDVPIQLLNERRLKMFGHCPRCTARNETTGQLEDRPDETRQAQERRAFHMRNNP